MERRFGGVASGDRVISGRKGGKGREEVGRMEKRTTMDTRLKHLGLYGYAAAAAVVVG